MPSPTLAIVCTDCIEDGENNLTIIRQLGTITIPTSKFPRDRAEQVGLVPPLTAVFVMRWDGGPDDTPRDLAVSVEIVTPLGKTKTKSLPALPLPEVRPPVEGGEEPSFTRIFVGLRSLPLDVPGNYHVRLLLQGSIFADARLFLKAAPDDSAIGTDEAVAHRAGRAPKPAKKPAQPAARTVSRR